MMVAPQKRLSVVINTCAASPRQTPSSTGILHSARAYALRNFIIPYYQHHPAVDELIVVGEWEPGQYLYLHQPSEHFNWNDALVQRQRGFLASSSPWVLFTHDDHWCELPQGWADRAYDVVVPDRWTRLRNGTGEQINNGRNDGYIMGHCAFFRRAVIDACPWDVIPPSKRIWDVLHTRMVMDAGFHIHWDDHIRCWDVEMGAEPWR